MELFDKYKHDSEKAEIFWPEILTKIREIKNDLVIKELDEISLKYFPYYNLKFV